jgi:mono/diheme cytochrome c family protein
MTYASTCVVCHRISGDGGTFGPDLTSVGERRDAAGIRAVIEDAKAVLGESSMPRFRDKLTPAQIDALVSYLANRR